MPLKRVLAFSSSRVGNSGYLQTAIPVIKSFLGNKKMNIAFIPFAAVSVDYKAYTEKVSEALSGLPYQVITADTQNAKKILEDVEAIMVGGGNTFKLLHQLYQYDLLELIKSKVNKGIPYIGWSAGSNICSPGIFTSNDMPITEPESFKALSFFTFQVNPHYFNFSIPGHNGETRDDRLKEYGMLNPEVPVIGLPEGTALVLDAGKLKLTGEGNATLFYHSNGEILKREIATGKDCSDLLK